MLYNVCFVFVWRIINRSPEQKNIPHSDSLALVESVANTKLNGAVKGATLLQLVSLSADAFQGLHGVYFSARASVLA